MNNYTKGVLILCLFIGLSSCKTFIQVYETESMGMEMEDGKFVFDNDTLQIEYIFWKNRGLLAFRVTNLTNRPLYIDWKKSSCILNSKKLDYWIDVEITNAASYYGGYFYNGDKLPDGYAVNEGVEISKQVKFKAERVTFIPPKSNYKKAQFYLLPYEGYLLNDSISGTTVKRNDNPKKGTKLYSEDFTNENTPLNFRNFMTYSFSEAFEDEHYIDNEFYISKVTEMDLRHFKFSKPENGEVKTFYPFKRKTRFYFRPYKEKTVEYRQKQSKSWLR